MTLTACGHRAVRRPGRQLRTNQQSTNRQSTNRQSTNRQSTNRSRTNRQKGSALRMTGNAGAGAADSHAHQRSTDSPAADHPVVSRPMESTHFARSDASALADLQLHWGGGYEIALDGDIWSATFRGTADQLRAHSATELRVLIRADDAYRQQAGPARHLPRSADPDRRREDDPAGPPGPAGDGVIRGERMSL
jgi:hypothetical protein